MLTSDSISLDPSSPTWLGGKARRGVRAGDREKTSQPLGNQSGAGLFLLRLLRGLRPHVESQPVCLQFPGLVLPRAPKGEPGRNLQVVNKTDSTVSKMTAKDKRRQSGPHSQGKEGWRRLIHQLPLLVKGLQKSGYIF